jgi:rhodanese-related sulfurtransferase
MDGEITVGELRELLDADADGLRLVDIRDEASFRRAHIPGSENVPFARLPDRVGELGGADRIVTICPHGQASVQAAQLIGSFEGTADATVESLAGGLEAWDGEFDSADAGDGAAQAEGDGDDAAQTDADAPF